MGYPIQSYHVLLDTFLIVRAILHISVHPFQPLAAHEVGAGNRVSA